MRCHKILPTVHEHFLIKDCSGTMGRFYVFQSPFGWSVDGQWTLPARQWTVQAKTKIILVDSWMELKFYFCPWDDTNEPPSRGLSLNNPLTIRGQLGQCPDGHWLFVDSLVDNFPARTQPHGRKWSSGLSKDCEETVHGHGSSLGGKIYYTGAINGIC